MKGTKFNRLVEHDIYECLHSYDITKPSNFTDEYDLEIKEDSIKFLNDIGIMSIINKIYAKDEWVELVFSKPISIAYVYMGIGARAVVETYALEFTLNGNILRDFTYKYSYRMRVGSDNHIQLFDRGDLTPFKELVKLSNTVVKIYRDCPTYVVRGKLSPRKCYRAAFHLACIRRDISVDDRRCHSVRFRKEVVRLSFRMRDEGIFEVFLKVIRNKTRTKYAKKRRGRCLKRKPGITVNKSIFNLMRASLLAEGIYCLRPSYCHNGAEFAYRKQFRTRVYQATSVTLRCYHTETPRSSWNDIPLTVNRNLYVIYCTDGVFRYAYFEDGHFFQASYTFIKSYGGRENVVFVREIVQWAGPSESSGRRDYPVVYNKLYNTCYVSKLFRDLYYQATGNAGDGRRTALQADQCVSYKPQSIKCSLHDIRIITVGGEERFNHQ